MKNRFLSVFNALVRATNNAGKISLRREACHGFKRAAAVAVLGCTAIAGMAIDRPATRPEALPGTRWWWLGSAVDSANIARNLAEYARTGIGSVEITPIYGVQGNDANDIQFLSDKWMQALADVQAAGAANGVLIDMNQGTGWPFGGPEVSIDDAACKVIFLVDTVQHGSPAVKTLPEREVPYSTMIAENRRRLPDGRDEIIRAFQSRTRQAVKRAAPGGEGLVIDHFDRNAVAKYLDKFDRAFSRSGNAYPHNFFNDSYEVYGANWTPTLFEEFQARRGYRLQDNLAKLLGHVDDGNQVLSDYRETLAELLLENFTRQWVDWCHSRGVQVRNQAHGSPANLIDLYAAVDVPEIEGFGLSDFGIRGLRTDPGFTRKNDSDVSMLKYASSGAHITGKPLTSSETFTWLTEHFRTSLSQMKPDLDLMFTCGVNHIFFHGTCYSPFEAEWPGWKFYASVDMSPTNSIWHDAPELMQYITRAQTFLQDGKPDNDFLVYLPVRDLWKQRLNEGEKGLMMAFSIHDMGKIAPDFINSVMTIDSLGFDCDYISDNYLMGCTADNGDIVTGAGTRYKALVIPGSGNFTPALTSHLAGLEAAGAKIIRGIDETALRDAVQPEQMRTLHGLRAIRRADADGHHYFIANLTPNDVYAYIPLTVPFSDAVWFDLMSNDAYRAETSGSAVKVVLRSGESRVLRTYDHLTDAEDRAAPMPAGRVVDITPAQWTLTAPESETIQLASLTPWTALGNDDFNRFAGTMTYETSFDFNPADLDSRWRINLGDVRESARVYLNGEYIGTAWAVPFTLDCTEALRPGTNALRIEVTNLPANRIADMDRNGREWRIFKEINIVDINYKKTGYAGWEIVPSGLNSTVTLEEF